MASNCLPLLELANVFVHRGVIPDSMLPSETIFAAGEHAKAVEIMAGSPNQPFNPATARAFFYSGTAIGSPYFGINEHYVRTRVTTSKVEEILQRQQETGLITREYNNAFPFASFRTVI
jgi:hypothetical protein